MSNRLRNEDVMLNVLEECEARCLHSTSICLSELLLSMSGFESEGVCDISRLSAQNVSDVDQTFFSDNSGTMIGSIGEKTAMPVVSQWLEEHEWYSMRSAPSSVRSRFLMGKSLFEKQEFRRSHFWLTRPCSTQPDGCETWHMRHPLLSFLAAYALFMEGQKSSFPSQQCASHKHASPNPRLGEVMELVQGGLSKFPKDAYLHWLHGVCLRDSGRKQDALSQLLAAVCCNPLLRCAWEDLGKLIVHKDQLQDVVEMLDRCGLFAPSDSFGVDDNLFSVLKHIFIGEAKTSLMHSEARQEWMDLQCVIPHNVLVLSMMANLQYHRKDFQSAKGLFLRIREIDPFRLDYMDEFSNVLFVLREAPALSQLADECYSVDPYRPESNCVVGNYYAVMQKHDRAIVHFKRAVAVSPTHLSAWTLLGHSFLEQKNANGAAEAYKAAVEIDERDYRPWYGLGQIYELLQMHHYALHYYWRTTSIRPNDPRMWIAVANCLTELKRHNEAVVCLQRAEPYEIPTADLYPILLRRIVEGILKTRTRNSKEEDRKLVVYLQKLVACQAVSREDLSLALPMLAQEHLKAINKLLKVPHRSPSFEPDAPSSSSLPRPSTELRIDEASRLIEDVETLVFRAETSLGAGSDEGELDRIKSDLQVAKKFYKNYGS